MSPVDPVDESNVESIRLVVGTYESTLYGLQTTLNKLDLTIHNNDIDSDDDSNDNVAAGAVDDIDRVSDCDSENQSDKELTNSSTQNQFSTIFSVASHLGSIKCCACDPSGEWMCSGGSDEIIKIYNLKKMNEYGALHKHTGAITHMCFYQLTETNDTFLLSTDVCGHIIIWSVKQWQCITIININTKHSKYANSYITDITIHKSGKFMICITNTGLQQIYSLLTFKCVYSCKLDKLPSHIQYNTSSTLYALIVQSINIGIYDSQNELTNVYVDNESTNKIISVLWLNDHILCIGYESGELRVYDNNQSNDTYILSENVHDSRVRAMCLCQSHNTLNNSEVRFATCSTDGSVCIWLYSIQYNILQPLAVTQSDSRLLCINNIPPYLPLSIKSSTSQQSSVLTVPRVSKTQQRILDRVAHIHMNKLKNKKQKQLHKQQSKQSADIPVNDLRNQVSELTADSSKHVHFSDTHSTSGSKSLNRKKLSTIPIDTNQSFINDQTDQNNSTNITNSTHSERVDNKQSSHSVPRSIPHTTITAATTAKSIASPVIAPSISVTPDEAIVSSKALRARKNNPRLDKFNGDEDDIPVLSNKILTVQQQPVVEFVSKHEQATNNGTKKKKKHRYQH